MDVIRDFGQPGATYTAESPGKVFGEVWYRQDDDSTVSVGSLPPVTDKRLFYSKGFMGTHHYLIYIEHNVVTEVFWRST